MQMTYDKARLCVRKLLLSRGMLSRINDDHFIDSCAGDLVMVPHARLIYIVSNNLRLENKRKWRKSDSSKYFSDLEVRDSAVQFYKQVRFDLNDSAEYIEMLRDVFIAMDKIKDKKYRLHKRILKMYLLKGMGMREIGLKLGISESRVCQRVGQIVAAIKDII